MKKRLTKEQSAHLISLGVPKEKASDKISYGFLGYDPIFNLTDLLGILPKEMFGSDINMEWHKIPQKWMVCYAWKSNTVFFKEELIDALYELCVWTIENKYLKF